MGVLGGMGMMGKMGRMGLGMEKWKNGRTKKKRQRN